MAKYGRFDPRNKKKRNDKYRSERKQNTKQAKQWKNLDYETNDLSGLRREKISTV